MVDLIILGSMGLDDIETPFGKIQNALGGSATYAAFAASFFAKPGIISVIGKDFPEQHASLLKEKGIDMKGVYHEEKTFRWKGFYEFDMNEAKTLKTELNSLATFDPQVPEEYRNAKYVFLGNTHPAHQLKVLKSLKQPQLVMLDTMNLWIMHEKDALLEAIKQVDILVMNDGEARMLFETVSLVQAAAEALKLGPQHVIIKKGEHGALYFTDGKHFNAPGYPLETIKDPTGCGDCFGGALLGYLAHTKDISEKNIRKAIVYGSVVASYNAEDFSVNRLKNLTQADIEKRYKDFQEIREF